MPRNPKLMLNNCQKFIRVRCIGLLDAMGETGRDVLPDERAAHELGARNRLCEGAKPMHRNPTLLSAALLIAASPPAAAQPASRTSADWRRGATCYEIFVRSFYDS